MENPRSASTRHRAGISPLNCPTEPICAQSACLYGVLATLATFTPAPDVGCTAFHWPSSTNERPSGREDTRSTPHGVLLHILGSRTTDVPSFSSVSLPVQSDNPNEQAELIAAYPRLLVENYCIVASSALLWFDFALTFTTEVRRIWRRRFTGATLVYLFTRYTALLDRLFFASEVLLWNSSNRVGIQSFGQASAPLMRF
ncbi:hypothetical protein BD310DRAFT_629608 [Dichomitus squalens]|uniref:DUF6533 domain-containing protein n=1 Tax=Dichomitus squalens TaxID=114155 RepID=A0A4Q9PPV3_9APHY|nr:hypothetical protein BD310DRAFT_629608 [Dichomitus squalens]